jgi:hypothetical protein
VAEFCSGLEDVVAGRSGAGIWCSRWGDDIDVDAVVDKERDFKGVL